MARIILNESSLLKSFLVDAMNRTYYILNKALIRPFLKKPPMSSILKENQMYHTFIYLVVNVLCTIIEKMT